MTAAGTARPGWARTAATSLVVGLATSGSIFAGMVALAPAAQADDASSAVTVTTQQQDPDAGNAPFPNLSVTVSQTKDLVNQGIRLTYSGGARSTFKNSNVEGDHILQVFQCWGDLKDAEGNLILDKNNQPQPDRTTCQYGSLDTGQGQTRTMQFPWDQGAVPAAVTAEDKQYLHQGSGPFDPAEVSIPFRSATGKTIARVVDGQIDPTVDLVSNEFFGPYTTNEVPWAGFGADGTGTVTFEVQTAMQAPGLGCGNDVTASDGTVTGQQPCWLVIVPRDHDSGVSYVHDPALMWQHWQHRLAVRLDFQPIGARCAIGAAERQISGSELVSAAIHSWQPVLCNQAGGSIYNTVVTNESDAAARANGTGKAPLALVSRPFDANAYGLEDNLTYAPIAVTGLTVVFAVDHSNDPFDPPPDDVQGLDQLPFTKMNLTPRLLAKLLTNSYRGSMPSTATVNDVLAHNAWNITKDPDFLEINPTWKNQSLQAVAALADVFVPLGSSDSAWAVWSYIMADQDARDFLSGEEDPWHMRVNPWATTDASFNAAVNPPDGVANEYPIDRFPRPDPSTGLLNGGEPASLVDAVAWRPFSTNFDQGAYWVLRGDNRTVAWITSQNSTTGLAGFGMDARVSPGRQQVMGLTDTASAATYQVYTAALLNPAGKFVEPSSNSMSAAAAAMTADAAQPQVLAFDATSDQAKAATDAYPLTVPVYVATNPAGGDAASRGAAVALIRYAAGDGQTPGTSLGQLPPGYAPIPDSWRAQARAAADRIAAGPTQTPTPTETASPAPTFTVEPVVNTPPSSQLPQTGTPPTSTPAASTPPSPTPSPTGPEPPVVGAATPDDTGTGAVGAAVPISAAGGLLAAAVVPIVARPSRRTP